MTANDLITDTLRELGVLAASETPEAADVSDCFVRLNRMIGNWATQGLTAHGSQRIVKQVLPNVSSLTIGPGGAIDVDLPVRLEGVNLIYDNASTYPQEIPLQVMQDDQWQWLGSKTLVSTMPGAVYYDSSPGNGLGTIRLWPVPTSSTNSLVLYLPATVRKFADLTTDYTFPAGYEDALLYNLAVRCAPLFGVTINPVTAALSQSTLADIKRANIRLVELESASPFATSYGESFGFIGGYGYGDSLPVGPGGSETMTILLAPPTNPVEGQIWFEQISLTPDTVAVKRYLSGVTTVLYLVTVGV